MTYEELLEENKKLKSEIEEAKHILRGGGLVDGSGNEIPTSLIERANNIVMILQSEADFANELSKVLEKYENTDG